MPRGDRTGPLGQGSRTGRGAGFCNGNNQPGCVSMTPGRGRGGGGGGGRGRAMGRGRGGGFGRGFGFGRNQAGLAYGTPPAEEQAIGPEAPSEVNALREEVAALKARLRNLESGDAK